MMATSTEPPPYVRSATPPIPSGTKPLQHQVAGHVFGRRNGQNYNKVGQFLMLLIDVSLFFADLRSCAINNVLKRE